jgi:hypothetical protein
LRDEICESRSKRFVRVKAAQERTQTIALRLDVSHRPRTRRMVCGSCEITTRSAPSLRRGYRIQNCLMVRIAKETATGRFRKIAILGISAGLAAFITIYFVSSRRHLPPGPLVWSETFQDYEVRIYRADEEASGLVLRVGQKVPGLVGSRVERWFDRRWPEDALEIRKNGKRIYWQRGFSFDVPQGWFQRDAASKGYIHIRHGPFRNGGGRLEVLECGERLTQIAHIESIDFGPELQDLDNDGRPEVIVNDNSFYHWPNCVDGEPMPKVVLRWQNGRYVPADALMKKPRPTAELAARAAAIRSSDDWSFSNERTWMPQELILTLYDLFYSGPEEVAWKFLDDAWKPDAEGKNEWAEEWRFRLEESDYWPELRAAWKSGVH